LVWLLINYHKKTTLKQSISIVGCGWLGTPLAEYLIHLGYLIKGSTTSKNKLQKLEAVGIVPFLINIESLSVTISEFLNSEIVIVTVPSKNIEGFKNLIAQLKIAKVKKVIFISATSVYANSNKILTEKSHIKPSPLAKIEQLFKSNTYFSTTIIRFGGLFGYNRNPGRFFSEGKIIGNPEGFVNRIHRDDCVGIIEQLIKKNIWNETLNACADTHPKRRVFYTKAAVAIGLRKPNFKENDTCGYKIISSQKLKKLLHFEFAYADLLKIYNPVIANIPIALRMKQGEIKKQSH